MQKQWNTPPAMIIDPGKRYTAGIATAKGNLVVQLAPEHAPRSVKNFVFLAREGFYDGVTFHRVIPNFVIQGGDPTGSGRGGPGYQFDCETQGNPLKHARGALSMAHAGANTNGSQFFIVLAPQPHLDGVHTVFGTMIEGIDLIDTIAAGDRMTRITISEVDA